MAMNPPTYILTPSPPLHRPLLPSTGPSTGPPPLHRPPSPHRPFLLTSPGPSPLRPLPWPRSALCFPEMNVLPPLLGSSLPFISPHFCHCSQYLGGFDLCFLQQVSLPSPPLSPLRRAICN